MERSFMLFSQLSAPSAMIGSASFQLLTSHYRPSCEHAALWLETNVWALITIWRENEIQGQLNLAVSSVRSEALEGVHQATTLLSWKTSFCHCFLAGGVFPSACRSHGSHLLVVGQEQLVLISCSKQGSPSCSSQFLGVLWSKLVWGGNSPRTEEQDTVSQQEAFASVGGLVGYILPPQETLVLQSLGLCPHPKYTYLQNTGFGEHINAWQSILVPWSGMVYFPVAVSWGWGLVSHACDFF